MQIVLTAFVTVLAGALTIALGQIILKGAIEPAVELKRLIGTIAHDIDYANSFLLATDEEQKAWRDRFWKHACSLREQLTVIVWYSWFERLLQLPPKKDVEAASYLLMQYSNRPTEQPFERLPKEDTKKLLRIKT
jgi:hypothetical protein